MTFKVHHDGRSWLVHSECADGQLTRFVFEEVASEEEVEQEESDGDA